MGAGGALAMGEQTRRHFRRRAGPNRPAPELIADLYENALTEDGWDAFSRLVGKAAGIENIAVWITDHGEISEISLPENWRPLVSSYRQYYSTIDPWAKSLAAAPLETPMLGYEHLREDELVRTEFYNDWARHGGMFRPLGVKMRLAPNVSATIGSDLPYARKRFEDADKSRLHGVLPYVKRSLQLRRRVRDAGLDVKSGAAAMDAYAFGAVVCDMDCRIVYANAAAHTEVLSGTGIMFLAGNRVSTVARREAEPMARLVRETSLGGAGGLMWLTDREGMPGLLALISPLPRQDAAGSPCQVLISLRRIPGNASFTKAMLIEAFRLSPAQAEIAIALYEGASVEEIAIRRNVKMTTMRTHLAEILSRTGTENLRDLVRLLATIPPLRQPMP